MNTEEIHPIEKLDISAALLLDEFDVQTPSEIALAKVVESSIHDMKEMSAFFCTHLEQAQRPDDFDLNFSGEKDFPTLSKPEERTLKFFSKEVDTAHKRYISSLTALKQAKSGPLQVNIKTNNAFLAQQNINTP